MNTIKKEKDEIRSEYKKKRDSMDASVKLARDKAICKSAMSLVSYRYADYVLMYAHTEGEIDISDVALDALKRGKKVAFPRCNPENHTMKYHIVTSVDDLKKDHYGIMEPEETLPVYSEETCKGSAICFVPGLVYDRDGYRLGYGKGFYDRYLSGFGGSVIGVVYSDFILPSVPRGRFDVSINILLTEKGVKITSEI